MTFAAPWGLLALLSLPAIVALHLYRSRLREQQVAGLFLFDATPVVADGGRTRTRLLRTPSFWLECLAALLLSLWLAGCSFDGLVPRHVVLVVDDSASMSSARTSDAARAAIVAVGDALGGADEVTVVRSGEPAQVVVGPRARRDALRTWLDGWRPAQPSHRQQPALDLGRDLAGQRGELVYVTDEDPGALAEDLRVIACGAGEGNAAVTTVQRATADGRDRLLVTVEAFGETAGGDVVVSDRARERLRMPLSLPPGGGDLQFAVPLTAADDVLRVELPADALAIDNVAWIVPEPAQIVGVCDQLAEEQRERLELPRVFAALRGWRAVDDVTAAQVVLRSAPGAVRDGQLEVVVAAEGARRGHRSPFVVDRAHELLRGAAFDGVAWLSGSGAPPGRVLVASGDKVLLSEQWLPAGRRLWIDLDASAGNLVRAPDWPILFANVLDAGRASAPGCAATRLRLGDELRYRGARGEALQLRGPDGVAVRATSRLLHVVARPGLYEVLGDEDRVLATVAARFVDVRESDLRRTAAFDRAPRLATSAAALARVDPSPLRRWLGLLLLAVVLADWWLLARGAAR